jgi:hypothetical protein
MMLMSFLEIIGLEIGMQIAADRPIGKPSFQLSEDEVATVVDLACRAAHEGRSELTPGMYEVPITIIVRKALRRIKKREGHTNLQVRGEHELEDMSKTDPSLLGRIDITLQFLHQFGDEDAYVGIECKRVGAGYSGLNTRYVTEGVSRFVSGQYSAGHTWGFMLGYVLVLPIDQITDPINARICADYGDKAKLTPTGGHGNALVVLTGSLVQTSAHSIRIQHLFVDMTPAA